MVLSISIRLSFSGLSLLTWLITALSFLYILVVLNPLAGLGVVVMSSLLGLRLVVVFWELINLKVLRVLTWLTLWTHHSLTPTLYLDTSCVEVRELQDSTDSNPDIKVIIAQDGGRLANISLDACRDTPQLSPASLELIVVGIGLSLRKRQYEDFDSGWQKDHVLLALIVWLVRRTGTHYERMGMTVMTVEDWQRQKSSCRKWIALR